MPCYFTFYKNITLVNVAHYSKIYYCKLFKIPYASNANGVSASKGRALVVILFVIFGN